MKAMKLLGIVLSSMLTLLGQTSNHKTTQVRVPSTSAPTKVSGDGVKTQSGLQ